MMPRQRDVVLEQIRIVGRSLRLEALIAAVVLGFIVIASTVDLVRGNAATWFDGSEWIELGPISFLLAFAVWRRDRRFGPAFLWTLPVDRRRLALMKVFAGWVWLMAGLATFVSWLGVLALLARVTVLPALWLWIIPFTVATVAYLLGNAFVLSLRHPLRWFLAAVGVSFLLVHLSEAVGPSAIPALLRSGFLSALDAAAVIWRRRPGLAQWVITASLWLGAALAALWVGVSRHRENR